MVILAFGAESGLCSADWHGLHLFLWLIWLVPEQLKTVQLVWLVSVLTDMDCVLMVEVCWGWRQGPEAGLAVRWDSMDIGIGLWGQNPQNPLQLVGSSLTCFGFDWCGLHLSRRSLLGLGIGSSGLGWLGLQEGSRGTKTGERLSSVNRCFLVLASVVCPWVNIS